ncbi:MAG: XRE family transcriptional regulator [Verrucomicrobiaceae bacterium]|nr:MAG: XRE family transcriptional regulator [Verrucomicrobiaceae bacterium]
MSQELRAKLKAARKKLEFTQNEAAKAWGVPLPTLICWENDQRTPAAYSLRMLNEMLDSILMEHSHPARTDAMKKTQTGGTRTQYHGLLREIQPPPCG